MNCKHLVFSLSTVTKNYFILFFGDIEHLIKLTGSNYIRIQSETDLHI